MRLIFLSLFCTLPLAAHPKSLYSSLDPTSITQHLAFYQLYPGEAEGRLALRRVWQLLDREPSAAAMDLFTQSGEIVEALILLINRTSEETLPAFSQEILNEIEQFGALFPNRRLAGYAAKSQEDVLALPSDQIDLARALLLFQLGSDEDSLVKMRSYEALIDLMALQIRARLSNQPKPQEIIAAINHHLFFEMGFRFPPHSEETEQIDRYTFLPSVLDARRGVCLGVSILYLSLAQRLALPLEIVTPPGHIFLRYRGDEGSVNIETTARGIDVSDEEYLSIETSSLPTRSLKEVVGLAFFNNASTFSKEGAYKEALDNYEKAALFLPQDPLLKELMGYHLLFIGEIEKAKELLSPLKNYTPSHAISPLTIPLDYLDGRADIEAIRTLFLPVEEGREALQKQREALEEVMERCPNFCAAHFQLALTWLKLHNQKKAIEQLEALEQLTSSDIATEYLLATLYFERYDYLAAWSHYKKAEGRLKERGHYPKALLELKQKLISTCPSTGVWNGKASSLAAWQ